MANTYTPMGSGLGNTASYQKSGTPLVVNGADSYTLKYVSRAITVTSTGGNSTISFDGDATVLTIPQGQSIRMEVKVLGFTLAEGAGASVSALVELTKIPSTSLDPEILDVDRDSLLG